MSYKAKRLPQSTLAVALAALAAILLPATADAQICGFTDDKTPARIADEDLWGGLQPLDTSGIPRERDTTWFDRNRGYDSTKPLYSSIDAEDGRVFAGFNLGFKVFQIDANGLPVNSKTVLTSSVPIIGFDPHDYFRVMDVDATPEGDVLSMTGYGSMGLTLWDVSNSTPVLLYQDGGDSGKFGEEVYVTRIGGVRYAFMAAQKSVDGRGVHVYNLDRAASLGSNGACVEEWPNDVNCAGAHLSRFIDVDAAHVHGAGNDQQGHFVATSTGAYGFGGMEIWDVSSPSQPQRVLQGFSGRKVQGVAMWENDGKLYLALNARFPDQAYIYDVSCVRSGNCSLGQPLYDFPLPGHSLSSWLTVTYSEDAGVPYLYFGSKNVYAIDVLQAEWLLDVSNPSAPVDVVGGNPKLGGAGQPVITVNGYQLGYWSWYYACHPTGSNWLEPARGVVYNGNFYRTATGIFDAHRVGETRPRVVVNAAAEEAYEGQAVGFTAQAFNCTPSPTGWSWSAGGGGVVSGTGAAVDVTWSNAGTYEVSASNSACAGADVQTDSVLILDAEPVIGAVDADVSSALVCSPVTFEAVGVQGRPPLTYGWEILDSQGAPLASPALDIQNGGETAVWDTGADAPADGTYTARLTVDNTAGSATASSAGVSLTGPGAPGFTAPIGASVSFGTVTFTANSTGATEWLWTFGDGETLQTKDPVVGPAPEHVYEAIGDYEVTLEVRNCLDPNFLASDPITVSITETNPLVIISFEGKCPFGHCVFDTGQQIAFSTQVEGDPEAYDYDWDGNGTFEDAGHTSPVTSHAYNQAGSYRPVLRVRRGGASKTFQHVQTLEVSAADVSLSVNGPSSGKVDTSYAFSANATGCSPAADGWDWTASGGGVVSGDGHSVSVRWSSTGIKTVRATNSACGTEQGSTSINITGNNPPPPPPPNPGGDLVAKFTVSPGAPRVGQQVTFNASASEGGPENYTWTIGGQFKSGNTVNHTFIKAGTYPVTLEVGRVSSACSFNFCTDTLTKNVTVTSDDPAPPPGPGPEPTNGCSGAAADDPAKLCLMNGRYQVEVDWVDHRNDREGQGHSLRFADSDVTGFFWFFNKNNIELIVKILDGADVNGNVWVFYGGLSDVYYEITVTDTETGDSKTYENLRGAICGNADTVAFPVPSQGEATAVTGPAFRPDNPDNEDEADPEILDLLDGRFEVTVDWTNHRNGATGTGKAVPGSDRSGYFWFFNDRNLELVVKMIDGRSLNGHFWVFYGGLSDVNYTVTVHDTVTGDEWTRTNPPGSICGDADTTAFDGE